MTTPTWSALFCEFPRLHQLVHLALSIQFFSEPNFRLCAAAEEACLAFCIYFRLQSRQYLEPRGSGQGWIGVALLSCGGVGDDLLAPRYLAQFGDTGIPLSRTKVDIGRVGRWGWSMTAAVPVGVESIAVASSCKRGRNLWFQRAECSKDAAKTLMPGCPLASAARSSRCQRRRRACPYKVFQLAAHGSQASGQSLERLGRKVALMDSAPGRTCRLADVKQLRVQLQPPSCALKAAATLPVHLPATARTNRPGALLTGIPTASPFTKLDPAKGEWKGNFRISLNFGLVVSLFGYGAEF